LQGISWSRSYSITERIEQQEVSKQADQHIASKQGFSLAELMIVVVIIAVLAGIAVPIYRNNVEKAKRSEVAVTMGYVKSQLDIYFAEYGEYPIASKLGKCCWVRLELCPDGRTQG